MRVALMNEFPFWLRNEVTHMRIAFTIWRASLTGGLTPSQAQRIVMTKKGPLDLKGIDRLTPEVAGILARHDDDLLLPSLAEISAETAQCLAQHRHGLYLEGCRSVSPAAAEALAVHGQDTLRNSWEESFAEWASWGEDPDSHVLSDPDDDLDLFTEALREAIFLKVQTLSLAGLRKLPRPVATALGQHKGTLILDGVRELDGAAAEGLKHHFGSLDLNGLRSLSQRAARALAYGGGRWPSWLMLEISLGLNGLQSIPAEVTGELAVYQGTLRLNGLSSLSVEAARNLARFEGTLCLCGLQTISVELAEALAEIQGRLRLPCLRSLSPGAAEILLSRPGDTLAFGLA